MTQAFEYYRPKTRAEAIDLLSRPNFNAIPLLVHPRPDLPGEMGADAFVDLSWLGLDYVRESADGYVHIGAATDLQTIMTNPVLKSHTRNLFNEAIRQVAPERIRNMSSLWGAIQPSHKGSPELLLVMLVLDAKLLLQGSGDKQRTISFPVFQGTKNEALQKGELMMEASFMGLPESGWGWALERVARTPSDAAIVAALAVIETRGESISQIRLALAGATPLPGRVETLERSLQDQPMDTERINLAARLAAGAYKPVADFKGSADYRCAMAEVVINRAILKAWEKAKNSLGS
jgi:CO/xanthine dehydrogenase FAD-binding subunit